MSQRKPELRRVPIEFLVPNKRQPRQHFDPAKLDELALSIKSTGGLLQPIVVRERQPDTEATGTNKAKANDPQTIHYEIIAGERRWRASQIAGIDTVDCLVRRCSDEEVLEASIIENVSRADLNPLEEARAYQRMIDEFDYVHDEIAAAVGKPRPNISNSLRLLNLNPIVQDWIINESLSAGHGKLLAGLPQKQQRELGQRCVNGGWSVRKLEQAVRKLTAKAPASAQTLDPNLQALENTLGDHIGCKVKIAFDKRQGRGKLLIDFHNLDVLSGLLKKIGVDM